MREMISVKIKLKIKKTKTKRLKAIEPGRSRSHSWFSLSK
jgi:hypothetical protein